MAKFPIWQPILVLVCAAFVAAGCNAPVGKVNPTSTAAILESNSFGEALGKVRVSIETLDGLIFGERGNTAHFESMKLVELVNTLRSHDPDTGISSPADDTEYNEQVKDLYFAANRVWSFTNTREYGHANDAMQMVIARYNRLSARFGNGDTVKVTRPSTTVASK